VELQQIVERYAEAIEHVDANSTHQGANRRTGELYLQGWHTIDEEPAVDALDAAWEALHPGERQVHLMKIRYPDRRVSSRTALDHVFTTDGLGMEQDEWGIEIKRLQFVGNNGKRNDFGIGKVLSPYLKDRSMLHDALRLREYGFTRRIAVVGYAFDYTLPNLAEAARIHTDALGREVLHNIAKMIESEGPVTIRPLMEFADAIFGLRGYLSGPRAQATFEAWRHPAGGRGVVFGWEIRRPQLEPDYDPRHPW
jgi:hypothetical protein